MMRTLHRPIVGRRGLAYQVSRIGRTWESFFQPAHKIVLKVPATTSNLGPGFDSFGLALDMGNRLTVERAEKFSLVVHGEGGEAGGVIAHDAQNLIVRSFAKIMTMFGSGRDALPFGELPPYRFECHNMVPAQRGLGRGGFGVDVVPIKAEPRLKPQRIPRAQAGKFNIGIGQK